MKLTLRIFTILIAVLFFATAVGFQTPTHLAAQPIQITDVQVPSQVAQAATGQVQATIHNPLNQSFDGFAQFSDNMGEIVSLNPVDPLLNTINITIGPGEQLTVVLDYTVADNATIGEHIATFEINLGQFSFLYEQYAIPVIPVAAITEIVPGLVFDQSQVGFLLVAIENRVSRQRSVRVEAFSPKFFNASEDVVLAPGQNNIVLPLMPNATQVYDFGMFPVNVTIYYFDEAIDSQVILVPVDMSPLNKVLAVILPVSIFLVLVVFYLFRKWRRIRTTSASE